MTAKSPFTSLIFNILPLGEKIFLAGLGAGLLLIYLALDTNVAFISLNGLAVVYFLYAYKPPEIKSEEDKPAGFAALIAFSILPKVMWISASVSMIGIMFHLLALAGATEMISLGATAIGTGLFILAIMLFTGAIGMKANVPMLIRVVPILIVDLYLLLVKWEL